MESLLSALLAAGLIDADTADILRRQQDEEQARQWAEQQLTVAALGGLSAQQQRFLALLAESDYRPSARQLADFWRREDDFLWTAMQPQIEQVLTERATFAAVVGGQAGTFNLVNRQVIQWAEDYYTDDSDTTYGSIPNLNLTSRQQVADAFSMWNRGELPGRPRGLPSLIEALTPTFGTVRADRIAVTETTRLFTESIRQAGLANKFTVAFRVLTSADERVCPICGPVHGSVVAKQVEGGFVHPERGSIGFPPFHVKCRCGITEETEATLKIPLPPEDQFVYGQTVTATAVQPPQKEQPVAVVPVGPAGRPVSAALQLPVRGKLKEPIADTVTTIDSVHGDGSLPDLPILQGSKTMPQQGYYKYLVNSGTPIEIKINNSAENPMNTTAHEIGHFLEAQGIFPGVRNNPAAQAQLAAVRASLSGSQAVQRLNNLLFGTEQLQINVSGVTVTAAADINYTRYLLDDKEVWARAYAQYIATKSQHPTMIEELRRDQAYQYPVAWADDDFEPVVAAIDNLFTALGWMK